MFNITENELIKFTTTTVKVAKKSLPAYSSKYSKQTYTQYQHLALLCLKERLNLNYRDLVQLIELMPKIKSIIGLKRIPHFTTIPKFFQKLNSSLFEDILNKTVELFHIKEPWVAVDGTGHATDQASLYYTKLKKQSKKKRKHYTKNQIAVDTQKQVILAQRVAKGPRHDSKDAIPTIRKIKKYKPSGFSLDKSFDSEKIHEVIREELKAISIIPPKKRVKKGKYRLNMLKNFDKHKYNYRNIVESVISVEKRVFGDYNASRSDRLRNKESKLRNVCYNIYKYVKTFILVILKAFLQSQYLITSENFSFNQK